MHQSNIDRLPGPQSIKTTTTSPNPIQISSKRWKLSVSTQTPSIQLCLFIRRHDLGVAGSETFETPVALAQLDSKLSGEIVTCVG